ncbi:hypothetical protein HMPREF1550_02587 [Actinomyces sp. oral taxon 877 str. F0543]|nr:hypothetical protein HMPREF1550_02587 [Actinomyces sp. oral taxon 877 str. F0543]
MHSTALPPRTTSPECLDNQPVFGRIKAPPGAAEGARGTGIRDS